MNWLWSLLLPEAVHIGLLCLGFLALGIGMAFPGTWIGGICDVIAAISGAAGLAGKVKREMSEVEQGAVEVGPGPPPRPPGHVEGDPVPPVFPPGTEAGEDLSPYDPRRYPG